MKVFVKKSILAGILIGIGGYAFLAVENRFVGAFVFAIGLISVILLGCNLYTGKVGYARSARAVPRLLLMCILNIAGASLTGMMTTLMVGELARESMGAKLSRPMTEVFVRAVICGALIYLAVELFKKTQHLLTIIIPVFVFVASGADHCIANAYYFGAGMMISVKVILYLVVCVIGNAVGSLIVSLLQVKDTK